MTGKNKNKRHVKAAQSEPMSQTEAAKNNVQTAGGVSDLRTLIQSANETLYTHLPDISMASSYTNSVSQHVPGPGPGPVPQYQPGTSVNPNPNLSTQRNQANFQYTQGAQVLQTTQNYLNSNPNQNQNIHLQNSNPCFPTDIHKLEAFATTAFQGQQAMLTFMDQINAKISAVQNTVSKLDHIEKDMSKIQITVSDLQKERSETRKKMIDFDTFAQTASAGYDDLVATKIENDSRFTHLESENIAVKTEVDELRLENEKLNEALLDLQTRTMQKNLLIFGVYEVEGPNLTSEQLVRDFFRDQLTFREGVPIDIGSLAFERVRRIGRRTNFKDIRSGELPRPRPIVVVFERFVDREVIKNAAPSLKGTRFSIREHFPSEIEERRKDLYPVMRKALENDANKVKLVKDKLFINNRLYEPSKNDKNSKFADKQVDQSHNQRRKYTSSQKSSRKNVNQNTQNLTQNRANRLNAIPEFSMPNKYEPLSRSVDSGEMPQRNTKRTASSPLETNIQNKEPRQSPDSDEERERQTEIEMDTASTAQMCHLTNVNCDLVSTTNMQTMNDTQTITVTAEIHSPSTDTLDSGLLEDQLNDK